MRRDGVSTILALLILGAVAYLFKDQLKAIVSGNRVGNTTRGLAVLGAPTALAAPPIRLMSNGLPAGEYVEGIGYIPQSQLDRNPNSPSGGLGITGYD